MFFDHGRRARPFFVGDINGIGLLVNNIFNIDLEHIIYQAGNDGYTQEPTDYTAEKQVQQDDRQCGQDKIQAF